MLYHICWQEQLVTNEPILNLKVKTKHHALQQAFRGNQLFQMLI